MGGAHHEKLLMTLLLTLEVKSIPLLRRSALQNEGLSFMFSGGQVNALNGSDTNLRYETPTVGRKLFCSTPDLDTVKNLYPVLVD